MITKTIRMLRILAIMVGACCIYMPKVSASSITTKESNVSFDIFIEGDLRDGDIATLSKFISRVPQKVDIRRVTINSEGGSVEAALAMGQLIRVNEFDVHVRGTCLSACIFILSAGVNRSVFSHKGRLSPVGVHRFYFSALPPGLSLPEVSNRYRAIRVNIAKYLEEMNIPPELLTIMESTPPESIRVFNRQELSAYRLEGSDPAYEERLIANEAYFHGISSAEFRKRSDTVEKVCGEFNVRATNAAESTRTNCRGRIMYGLSEAEYLRRSDVLSTAILELKDVSKLRLCMRQVLFENKSKCN